MNKTNKIPKSYKIDPEVIKMIEEIKEKKVWPEITVIEQSVREFYKKFKEEKK